MAELKDSEILRLNKLRREVMDKTRLEPLFFTKKGETYFVSGLNENFFVEYAATICPNLRFSSAEQTFFDYDKADGLFKPVKKPLLIERILTAVFQFAEAYAEENEEEAGQVERFRNVLFGQKIAARLEGRCFWDGEWNRTDGLFIHVQNGVLEVSRETGEVRHRKFSPSFNSIARIEIDYDPKATCPLLTAELERRIPDPDQRELFLKAVGQILLGQNLATKILVIHGEANSGKSQIADLVVKMIGVRNCREIRLTETSGRFELGQYRSASLLKSFDCPANFLMNKNCDVLKRLTGGDEVGGELKYGEQTSFKGDKNVLLTTNFQLQIREGKDERAIARRLIVIEWKQAEVKKRIANFADYLMRKEASGILNLFLGGMRKALADLREGHPEGFRTTQVNRAAVEVVMERSNSVARFVRAYVERCDGAVLMWSELEDRYNQFCGEKRIPPVGPKALSKEFNVLASEEFNSFKSRRVIKNEVGGGPDRRETLWSNIRLKAVSAENQPFSGQNGAFSGENEAVLTPENDPSSPNYHVLNTQNPTETASTEGEILVGEADFLTSERVLYSDA